MKRKVDFDWYCKTKKDVINNAAYELIVALTAKSAPPRKFELSIPQWDDLMIANIVEKEEEYLVLLFFLLFRRSLVRIIGQGSCYDAYSTEGTYLIGGENIWIYSILTTMAR